MAISQGTFTDNNGNYLTSQQNGTQQALDVGINVSGVQVDPRQTRNLTATADTVTISPSKGTVTDHSGTATTTSASVMAANPNRKFLMIQNLSGAKLYINFGVTATQSSGSVLLAANGGSFTMEGNFVSTDQIFAVASANNTLFTAKEG